MTTLIIGIIVGMLIPFIVLFFIIIIKADELGIKPSEKFWVGIKLVVSRTREDEEEEVYD